MPIFCLSQSCFPVKFSPQVRGFAITLLLPSGTIPTPLFIASPRTHGWTRSTFSHAQAKRGPLSSAKNSSTSQTFLASPLSSARPTTTQSEPRRRAASWVWVHSLQTTHQTVSSIRIFSISPLRLYLRLLVSRYVHSSALRVNYTEREMGNRRQG